ncbi:RHS repeat-associated core domain-containing protein [Litorimonas haliclonae]|uniref:RHS repeat-associated core domain-containing protein n=1 Tax=Litorimonas haliclonae TaxID=2081977 RepID=UPI0039EEBE46
MSAALDISHLPPPAANDNAVLPARSRLRRCAAIVTLCRLRPLRAHDGNLKRVRSVVNGRTIYNVYNMAGQLVHVDERPYTDAQAQSVPEKRTDYVKLNGMAIARVENKTTPIYSFSDHLGSPVAVWKQGGSIERERYMPFGIAMDNPASLKDQAGFTGHIKDSATGLNYMQARSYDPVLGRFLSIDPMSFLQSGNPAQFNRYTYGNNDPVNLIDPDGAQAVRPPIRPTPRGHNGGPPMLQYSTPITPIRNINPDFRPAQMGFVRDNNSIPDWNNYINDIGHQYNILGTGNLDGSRTSTINDTGGMTGASIQNVLANSTLDKTLKGNGFQFQGSGGLSGAADAFKSITGQSLANGNNAKVSIGATDVNVNFHHSKTSGAATVQINLSTSRPGSRIKARTTVKIRFEEQNK